MKKRISLMLSNFLIGMGFGLCLIVLLGIAGYYLIRGLRGGPAVDIRVPRYGEQVDINNMTLIQAIARDPQGVLRVELWADGELVAVKTSQFPKGSTPLPLLEDWKPRNPGPHILVVRAYNSRRRSGQATVVVEAADLPDPQTFMIRPVQEGETLEGIPTLDPATMAGIAEEHPELGTAVEAGEVLLIPSEGEPAGLEPEPAEGEALEPLEGPPPAVPSDEIMGWIPGLIGLTLETFEIDGEWLEVEALSLAVDRHYDDVHCFVTLGNLPTERIPAEGSLENAGGDSWAIEALMGEENRRIVPIPEGRTPLNVEARCLGIRGSEDGDLLFDLGTLTASHPESEWDGRRQDRQVIGPGGWFRVAYRIIEVGYGGGGEEEPFPAPSGLSRHCFINRFLNVLTCMLTWYYPEDRLGEISGYLIVKNGTLYMDLPLGVPAADERTLPLFQPSGIPACGETYEYYVIAYHGDPIVGPRSGPSNTLVLRREACESRHVTVNFETLNTGCLTGDCAWKAYSGSEEWDYGLYVEPFDPDGCRQGHCDLEGEYYGRLWANEHEVWLGGMNDFGITFGWDTGGVYSIADMPTLGESNPVHLDLNPYEYLEIAMKVWDDDHPGDDDVQCDGGYFFSPDDLRAIASMPDHRQTFTHIFQAEGSCWLVYSIEVMPIIKLFEPEPREQWP